MSLTLRRLRFYTKDEEEMVHYKRGTAIEGLPVVDVYEYTGPLEQAIEAFRPLNSFAVARRGDSRTAESYMAFPLKGYGKVRKQMNKLLYRFENGKMTELDSACKVCKNRVKNMLSGCSPCDSLRKMPQHHAMRPLKIKGSMDTIPHESDTRTKRTRDADQERKPRSAFLR